MCSAADCLVRLLRDSMAQVAEFDLRFSSTSQSDSGAFKLLELPPDLCKLIEAATDDCSPNLTIKGVPDEDAVLCTADKTYTVRSVALSNSVLVVTPDSMDEDKDDQEEPLKDIAIRDQLHEVIELVPSVPRLHKLNRLLKGREYDEGREDEDPMSEDGDGITWKQSRVTYEEARVTIQASDAELDKGLRDRRVLILKGELRPIAPSHLTTILELLLTNLVSLSLLYTAAPVSTLLTALEDEHEIRRDVARQVMTWFGRISEQSSKDETWEMDADAVVREVGLGILRVHRDDPIAEKEFLSQWRKAVGDTFQERVDLALLSGNYLTSIDSLTDPPVPLLTYFPSSALPVEPGARFAELFLVRSRWKADDISPFLSDIAVDSKERDKLLLKHARAITDPEGIWYTARAKYGA
ncbi:sister chromatid cohesion protein Dcc1 [Trametes punicea]|nr:sister chromatid cohesion protein Dcc1 [Trametes punicea]